MCIEAFEIVLDFVLKLSTRFVVSYRVLVVKAIKMMNIDVRATQQVNQALNFTTCLGLVALSRHWVPCQLFCLFIYLFIL